MAKALSVDLRRRVIAAIDGGLSCRQAADRFGVSAASAIRWRSRHKEIGDIAPQRQGGDRKSQRIEALSCCRFSGHRDWVFHEVGGHHAETEV